MTSVTQQPSFKDRAAAINAIIEKERETVKVLQKLNSEYVSVFRTLAALGKQVMDEKESSTVFRGVSSLLPLHETFLNELQSNPDSLGRILLPYAPQFKTYEPFINGRADATATLAT